MPMLLFAGLSAAAGAQEPAAVGPRLTDAELFDALDLALPELAAVQAAVAAGDLGQAKHALAAYLRDRRSVPWWFDPHQVDRDLGCDREAADRTVRGEIQQVGIWYTFPGSEVDWFANPTVMRDDLPDDMEWQWQLNRMGFWYELGRAYWATGDERYAEAFVRQLRGWARQCPRPDGSGNQANSAWRTIEAGIRMGGSWPDAYHRFLQSPTFADDDVCLYLKLCLEHALHLSANPTGGNWLTMEMCGLYTVGAVFPELKAAAAWRAQAIGSLHEELQRQFYSDGAQTELSPGYHQVALRNILQIAHTARLVGRQAELPEDYIARTERAFDYNLWLMTPDRDLPKLNDSWSVNVPTTLREASGLFPGRSDFRWAATDGQEGEPPAETSHVFSRAGYVAMRAGWEGDANYLCFDAGPLGTGHWHQDKLNVVLWAYGREVLFDGGGGMYERSPWRSWATDTFSHNTVLVDGRPQRRGADERATTEPLDLQWESDAAHDFAVGVYNGTYGPEADRAAVHTRRVLFVKPDLFVVADTLAPQDEAEHTVEARWHLLPTAVAQDPNIAAVTTAADGQPNLAVVPLVREGLEVRAVSAQREPELLGWLVTREDPRYIPATTVTHARTGTGVQSLLTLLLPLRAGEASPVMAVTPAGPLAAEVTLADGRRFRIEADPAPTGPIAVTETLADGAAGRSVTTAGGARR